MVTRTEAIARIAEGLGFRSGLDTNIQGKLVEAQRDLELGKTLPRFLIVEDQAFLLATGLTSIAKPAGFIRMVDRQGPHLFPDDSDKPFYLKRRDLQDAQEGNIDEDSEPESPKIYVIRQSVIDFVVEADQDYSIIFSYYKNADSLASNETNAWLDSAPEWLIGEAGFRMAQPLRDKGAMEIFNDLRTRGRAAVFGEEIASDLDDAELFMGENL